MTKTALALATALIAATTLTNAAEAGVKLGFGLPLGVFVASELMKGAQKSHNSSRRGGYEHAQAQQREAKAARAAKIAAAKREGARRQAVAKAEAAERAEARARKSKAVANAPEATRDVEVKTAKIETKTVATDAAPAIYVPTTPDTAAAAAPSPITTSSIDAEVAKVGEIDDAVKITAPKTTPVQPIVKAETSAPVTIADSTEAKPAQTTSDKVQRICRRFSAAIAGLVDIPCE